jgi:hypothetical protein
LLGFDFSSLGALLAALSLAANAAGGMTGPAATLPGDSRPIDQRSQPSTGNAVEAASMPAAPPPAPAWGIVTSANTSATQSHILFDTTCSSASQCWAVGTYQNPASVNHTLIEQLNGSSWAIVPSPNTSTTQSNLLSDVVCTSASQCWAVGFYYNTGGHEQTLIEQWNGASWAIASSPNNSTTASNLLYSVTCASASQCWAVGYYVASDGTTRTLIERWNGTSWAIVSSPNVSTFSVLNSVACTSTSQCWAVGLYFNAGGYQQTLIERWNGTSWAIVSSPNSSTTEYNVLASVTCTSESQCWAVGNYALNNTYLQTLIERWNGTAWTIVSSPNTSATEYNLLSVVTCVSASQCWAVGYSYHYDASLNEIDQTLIEQWNGSAWSIVTSPNRPTRANGFYGAACVSASQCFAVGTSGDQTLQTLIEEFAPSPLGNISTRLKVLTGNNVLIGGFIINGIADKEVLVRGLGPTLSQFGITGVLADPTLALNNGSGALVASNDNWKNTQAAAIMATGKAPPNDLESAILKTLPPGNYTAVLSGKNNVTGIGLMDVYDIDQSVSSTLTNISSRGFVGVDNEVMIGGFIVRAGGSGSVKAIVRVLGPTLTQFGVPNVLVNPTLEVRDVNGILIASNDNWQDTQKLEIQASGFAPPNAAESAAIVTQAPGNSTIIVRGKNNTSGNALVEVYQIP